MKEESVLNVLMYLFKNHMQNSCELDTMQITLLPQLEELGFQRKAIHRAFEWLENLAKEESETIQLPQKRSLRVFTEYECELLSMACRSFLVSLEQQGVLNAQTRELVINQVLELAAEDIDVSLIKWVTLMVLFNQPDEKHALACMELLVLEDTVGGLH